MIIVLISPPFGEQGQKSKGLPMAPPVLEYLAGLTRRHDPEADIRLIDANVDDFDPDTLAADLVGFTVLTPQALWVYRQAAALAKRGIQVILGGIHVSILPEETKPLKVSAVTGEVEEIWGEILSDARKRIMKPRYTGGRPELINLPRPVTTVSKTKYRFGSFFTSRGCPFDCTFCSVHEHYGRTLRFRPINEVVSEIAASNYRLFWGIDDNVWGTDINRAIELYREMKKNISGKYWFGSADLVTIDNPRSGELLDTARGAGLRAVLAGWESENLESLKHYKALSKQGKNRVAAIKKIRDSGIEVMLFIVLGGRYDTADDYHRVLELCDSLNISAHPTMLTPFPGTELYRQYKPHLVHDGEWNYFDGNHALFEHPSLSHEERKRMLLRLRAELFTMPRILKRLTGISRKGFPVSHIMSFMLQYPQGKAFREVYDEYIRAGENL